MPPRRRNRPAPAPQLNEAAQLADELQQAGYTKRDIARIINRDPSLVSQFYTKNKGAAFVPALQQVLIAIQAGGITDLPELTTLAARHITRRTTTSGTRARVRTKALLITPTGTGTGRVAAQAIASGSARLRPLIAEAARQNLRLA
ncbi:helix-turn-helix domain containing protein, partial [Streptomyces tauricus]